MHTSSSANRTCSELSSACEYTATVLMPSSRQAKIIRSATSPRFAIRIFLNIYRRAEQAPPLHWRPDAARAPPPAAAGRGPAPPAPHGRRRERQVLPAVDGYLS